MYQYIHLHVLSNYDIINKVKVKNFAQGMKTNEVSTVLLAGSMDGIRQPREMP
jgi:hypothetical protein